MFHPSDHLSGPPLDPLQELHVFSALRMPELDTGFQVGSHQSKIERQKHLPQPVVCSAFHEAQNMIGLFGCKHTLLASIQLFVHQCVWWCSPHAGPLGNFMISQHCVLVLATRAASWYELSLFLSWLEEQWDGMIRQSLTVPGTSAGWIVDPSGRC